MTTRISTDEINAMAADMSERTRSKVWNHLELLAENAALKAEVERLRFEKREAAENYASIARMAEQQALELLQVRQGMARRVRWKCRLNQDTTEAAYAGYLNDGWEIVHRQFENGKLKVVAQIQERIDPPAPAPKRSAAAIQVVGLDDGPAPLPVWRMKREDLNGAIMAAIEGTFAAAGGGKPIKSIREVMGHGRTEPAEHSESAGGGAGAADAE